MTSKCVCFLVILLIFMSGLSSVSASPPARIIAGIVTNVVSTVFKWLWSLTTTQMKTDKAVTSRSSIKFEGGYTMETLFDASKAGIEAYSVQTTPTGELLILDSANSNLYRVPTPLSRYSRPKLVVGSAEGYTGHVDGKLLREARMFHPKGLAVDDSGNIYIADSLNMAIRKITDAGITTIAGGKWKHGDSSPSEDAKLSDDFDIVYIRSSCSLLVTDRGNQAIREIQLHVDDCSSYQPQQAQSLQPDDNFNVGIGVAVLGAAIFFGYMLALLKQRVQSLFSSKTDRRAQLDNSHAMVPPYQYQVGPKSVRPPLMPDEDEYEDEDEDEGLFFSFGKLLFNASSSVAELFTGFLFSGLRKKRPSQKQKLHHVNRHPSYGWPVQETYALRAGEDEHEPPPPLEPRSTTPPNVRKTAYENAQQQFKQSGTGRPYYEGKDQQMAGQIQQKQQQQQQKRQSSGNPKSSEEKAPAEKSEIVFGAVQEQDGRREAMVIKAVDFSDPRYNQHNIRPRLNYMGYSSYTYS